MDIRHNTNGTILLTVIILTMILSVIVISVMSVTTSQVKSSESIIDDLKATYLAEGHFYKYQQELIATGSPDDEIPDTALDSKTFSGTVSNQLGGAPNNTYQIIVGTSWPSN